MQLSIPRLEQLPEDGEDLVRWLNEMLDTLDAAFSTVQVDAIRLTVLYEEPKVIEDNMLVAADGTTWNPGSGAGLYVRRSNAWVKVG